MLTAVHGTEAVYAPQMITIDLPTAQIRIVSVGRLDNNVYVLACRATNQAVIIDAAGEPDKILPLLTGLTPIAVLTTHGHADHIGAAPAITSHLGIPFRMHEADGPIAGRPIDQPLTSGEISVGELQVTALHTPGHTPGSMCFTLDSVVFTGDTLFPGGPGATRFPYSDFDQIMRSLRNDLFTLPDETRVLPGHGAATEIGIERPQVPEWQDRRW